MKITQLLLGWVITSSALILVVLVLRALLGNRVSACLRYALWAVVLVRLLVPVYLFHIPFAGAILFPETQIEEITPPTSITTPAESVGNPVLVPPASDGATVNRAPSAAPSVPAASSTPNIPDLTGGHAWLGWVWLSGSVVMAAVLLACNLRFSGKLRRVRLPLENADCFLPVYVALGLPSPCLSGLIRPAIYVTPDVAVNPVLLRHVLAHETTHFRHGDRIWNVLRSVALAIHWWNPLVWAAVVLSRRDCELACDEGALKRLDAGERIAYGRTLLVLVKEKSRSSGLFTCATTMTEDQKGVIERVQRIAHVPKRAAWAAALAVVLAIAVTACAFSSAAAPQEKPGESPGPVTSESPEPAAPEDAAASAQVNGKTVTLTMDYQGGNPDGEVGGAVFTVAWGGNQARFTDDWVEETPITLAGVDLDGDGTEEVVLAYTTSHLTGGLLQSLRVFDGDTLNERATFTRDDLPGVIFEQVRLTGKGDCYDLSAPGVTETIVKSEWDEGYPTETDLMNTMVFGYYYEFSVADGRLYCDLGIWQGQCGSVRVELGLEDGGLACKSFRYLSAGGESTLLATYNAVLSGTDTFQYVSDGKATATHISDVPALFDPYDSYMQMWDFTVVDLDCDGEIEVVFTVSGVSGDMGGYLVLHRMDGQVYGYPCGFRTFGDLRTDGTFECTDPTGKRELFVCQASFSKTAMTLTKLTSEVDSSGRGEGFDTYYVNGETVTKAEYDVAYAAWEAQPLAQWYEFTPENIAAVFST